MLIGGKQKMAKMKIKPIFLIIGAIVLLFFFSGRFNLGGTTQAAGDISSAIVTRSSTDTTVIAGETFTITYVTSGAGSGSWGVLVEDDITGGCTPTTFDTGWLSDQPDKTKTYTSPASAATCTLTGVYQFSGTTIGTEGAIQGVTEVTVLDCTNLRQTAGDTILAWSLDPTSANKLAALTAIQAWAGSC